jgi:hypothetical protein
LPAPGRPCDRLGERDELKRRERLGAHAGVAPDRAEPLQGTLPGDEARQRQRVGQGLAPVAERARDDSLDRRRRAGPGAPEGYERRLDVRPGSEDLAGNGMEAGPLGRELHQHRHAAVRLGRRLSEEPVSDLALNHYAPALDLLDTEALRHERRRDVVGQVRDQLARRRVET